MSTDDSSSPLPQWPIQQALAAGAGEPGFQSLTIERLAAADRESVGHG
jgi:hypothetical protein